MKWPDLDLGSLIHRITIERPVTVAGSSGSKTSFIPFVTARASIEPQRAVDVIRNGQTVSAIYTNITMAYANGVESNMQVQGPDARYVIEGVIDPQKLHVSLVLICVELKGAR